MGVQAVKSHAKGQTHKSKLAELLETERSCTRLTDFIGPQPSTSTSTTHDLHHDAAGPPIMATSTSNQTLFPTSKDAVLDAEIMWSLYTIEHHHSYASNDPIKSVFSFMFQDSCIARDFSCGAAKTAYMCKFGLAPYFRKLLKRKIGDEDYVLLFDESLNKATKTKQLDIHLRFFDSVNGLVATRYLDSQYMGHASAEDLMTKILESTTDLTLQKLLQVSPLDGYPLKLKLNVLPECK